MANSPIGEPHRRKEASSNEFSDDETDVPPMLLDGLFVLRGSDELPRNATNVWVTNSGKIRELGIFTVGIGFIIAALTLYVTFIVKLEPGRMTTLLDLVAPLTISIVYIVLGILTQRIANPSIIWVTMSLVTLGAVFDLVPTVIWLSWFFATFGFRIHPLVGFYIFKTCISGAVIWLIIKTGMEALTELKRPAK